MLAVVIPAAGASSRMRGGDKLTQDVGGRPALLHTVSAAQQVASHVCVALPVDPNHARWQMLSGLEIQRVTVDRAEQGIGVSIAEAVAELPSTVTAVMICLPDMPDIGPAEMAAVAAAWDSKSPQQIVQATTGNGLPGHPTLFGADYFPDLRQLTGDRGAFRTLQDNASNITQVPLPGGRARRDLDTPEEWAAWRDAQD